MHTKGNIGTELLVQEWRIWLHGLLDINGCRERLIIDFDQVSCIASCIAIVCNDHCHWIAVEPYLPLSQRAMSAHPLGNFSQRDANSDIANCTFEVLSSIDSHNAGKLASCIG